MLPYLVAYIPTGTWRAANLDSCLVREDGRLNPSPTQDARPPPRHTYPRIPPSTRPLSTLRPTRAATRTAVRHLSRFRRHAVVSPCAEQHRLAKTHQQLPGAVEQQWLPHSNACRARILWRSFPRVPRPNQPNAVATVVTRFAGCLHAGSVARRTVLVRGVSVSLAPGPAGGQARAGSFHHVKDPVSRRHRRRWHARDTPKARRSWESRGTRRVPQQLSSVKPRRAPRSARRAEQWRVQGFLHIGALRRTCLHHGLLGSTLDSGSPGQRV